MTEVVSAILLMAGSLVILIGSVGLLRLPNFFSRLHSAGVIDTLGAWLVLLALLLLADDVVVGFKVAFIGALLFMLSPVSSHALAKAGKAFGLRTDTGADGAAQGPGVWMINIVIDLGLLALLLGAALVILRIQSPLSVVILTGIYSLALCTLFVVLDAVDVAFTEAAVGAGISTILFLAAIRREDEKGLAPAWPSTLAIAVGFGAGLLVVAGTYDMPLYGDPDAPAHHKLAPRFLGQSGDEIGIPNVVTSVLASYRGYDTLGEVVVIFTAGIAVLLLLATAGAPGQGAVTTPIRLLSNPVLKTVLLRIIPVVLLFALYVQFHGDYGPGGGFQAGVIFGAGLITYGLLTSPAELGHMVKVRWANTGMALGVLIYGGVGIATMIMGGNFLDYTALATIQTTGQHIGILIIEFGVGMTVASTMVSLYFSLNRQQGPSQ